MLKVYSRVSLVTLYFLQNSLVTIGFWLQYIEETEELAMRGLRDNRHILDMITKELLEKSRITGLVY